jgi:hypothetical protein
VPRGLLFLAALGVVGIIVASVVLWRSSDGGETFSGVPAADPGPAHVHGLGVNPADGALFIATHTGLYRVDEADQRAKRVGERFQDTMGFTIVGPNRFLGSGHPDINEAREKNLPSLLGLIESIDSGETWQPISLLGEADFHVLRFAGERVYGDDSSNDRLLSAATTAGVGSSYRSRDHWLAIGSQAALGRSVCPRRPRSPLAPSSPQADPVWPATGGGRRPRSTSTNR